MPHRFRSALLLATCCSTVPTFAQKANIWYFGLQAGMDFSGGSPTALLDGAMTSFEASASICDDNGQLLFYSNGGPLFSSTTYRYGYVFDRNHDVMPNGDLELSGGCNSARSALIVQDPGDGDHYYLFTLDCYENGLVGGLRYCEIDMSLNGGLGDVTAIGTPLFAGVTESAVGIRHANGVDVWVLVHGLNNSDYHAFLVTSAGITGPVTTTIGPMVDDQPGDLAVNLTSTKVHYGSRNNSTLLDFDPATGILSNLVDLGRDVMGCAFAPGGRYLYTAEFTGSFRRIFQYDLIAVDIPASELIIGSITATPTALLPAPDGKIYVAIWAQQHLGVIAHPDSTGTSADFQEFGFDLGGRSCEAALPSFVNDLLVPSAVGITEEAPAPTVQCTVIGDGLRVLSSASSGQARLSIFRSDGSLVHERALSGGMTTVPLAGYVAGLYVARVVSADHHAGSASFVLAR